MSDCERTNVPDEALAERRSMVSLRTAMAWSSVVSVLLGLPFVQRLLAAGLGAILVALAALVGLQLLVFLAFKGLGLLPSAHHVSEVS